MIYMQSINGSHGIISFQVRFDVGTDFDLDEVAVQNRLAQAMSSLPLAVSAYGLTTQQTVGIPLLVFSITSVAAHRELQSLPQPWTCHRRRPMN